MARRNGPVRRVRNRRNAPANEAGGATSAIFALELTSITQATGAQFFASLIDPLTGNNIAFGDTGGIPTSIPSKPIWCGFASNPRFLLGGLVQTDSVIDVLAGGGAPWISGEEVEFLIPAFSFSLIGGGGSTVGPNRLVGIATV